MKITEHDLGVLRRLIEPHDTPERRKRYLEGDFHNAHKVRDLNCRYRWDLYTHCVPSHDMRRLYDYLDDKHIDTALRSIVKEL